MDMIKAALEYAELGFRVLPLRPGTKVPDLRHWPEEASTDPDVIRRHFALSARRHHDEPNVGICTGAGLVVVDVDTHHGGEIPAWLDTSTASVKTASGGLHYYFSTAGAVPNSVGRLAPGVDVRGERGQVAAPPSYVVTRRYDDGGAGHTGRYEWLNDNAIKPIDYNLLIPQDMRQDFTGVRRGFDYRDKVPVGERNNYLTSLAGFLFRQDMTHTEVLAALNDEVEHLGFTPRDGEVPSIVRSIGRYH